MTAQEETCKTCRFWKLFQVSSHRAPVGGCHRFPPTQLMQGSRNYYDFPMTDEWVWCGEWRPKYGDVEVTISADDKLSPVLKSVEESIQKMGTECRVEEKVDSRDTSGPSLTT